MKIIAFMALCLFVTGQANAEDSALHMAHMTSFEKKKMDYYPLAALDAEVSGAAVVKCKVLDTGRLANCVILQEGPKGYGFGKATIALVEDNALVDLTQDKVGDEVAVLMNWAVD